MSRERRFFPEEFKREAVKLTRQPGASKAVIARDLGIGANLLGRWVREESDSTAQGGKNVRRELASRYLRQPQLPISHLAPLLGYSETSAFSRAFRRWFGVSPRQWRREDSSLS